MIFLINHTPLHHATRKSRLCVVEYLINQGADYRDGIRGESYLHWASSHGHLSIVESLINQKAEINIKDEDDMFSCFVVLLFI